MSEYPLRLYLNEKFNCGSGYVEKEVASKDPLNPLEKTKKHGGCTEKYNKPSLSQEPTQIYRASDKSSQTIFQNYLRDHRQSIEDYYNLHRQQQEILRLCKEKIAKKFPPHFLQNLADEDIVRALKIAQNADGEINNLAYGRRSDQIVDLILTVITSHEDHKKVKNPQSSSDGFTPSRSYGSSNLSRDSNKKHSGLLYRFVKMFKKHKDSQTTTSHDISDDSYKQKRCCKYTISETLRRNKQSKDKKTSYENINECRCHEKTGKIGTKLSDSNIYHYSKSIKKKKSDNNLRSFSKTDQNSHTLKSFNRHFKLGKNDKTERRFKCGKNKTSSDTSLNNYSKAEKHDKTSKSCLQGLRKSGNKDNTSDSSLNHYPKEDKKMSKKCLEAFRKSRPEDNTNSSSNLTPIQKTKHTERKICGPTTCICSKQVNQLKIDVKQQKSEIKAIKDKLQHCLTLLEHIVKQPNYNSSLIKTEKDKNNTTKKFSLNNAYNKVHTYQAQMAYNDPFRQGAGSRDMYGQSRNTLYATGPEGDYRGEQFQNTPNFDNRSPRIVRTQPPPQPPPNQEVQRKTGCCCKKKSGKKSCCKKKKKNELTQLSDKNIHAAPTQLTTETNTSCPNSMGDSYSETANYSSDSTSKNKSSRRREERKRKKKEKKAQKLRKKELKKRRANDPNQKKGSCCIRLIKFLCCSSCCA